MSKHYDEGYYQMMNSVTSQIGLPHPTCKYEPGTEEAAEWWRGAQAALDAQEKHDIEVNTVQHGFVYKFFATTVYTVHDRFFSAVIYSLTLITIFTDYYAQAGSLFRSAVNLLSIVSLSRLVAYFFDLMEKEDK